MNLTPPVVAPDTLPLAVRDQGHAVLNPQGLCSLTQTPLADLMALNPSWNDLPPDAYLRDGGRYRKRRHSCFVVDADAVSPVPRRAHWQPLEYNALHGGLERWFEPMNATTVARTACRNCCAGWPPPALKSRARSRGSWKRTSSASTPPTASAAPRPKALTVTASTSWWSPWSTGWA